MKATASSSRRGGTSLMKGTQGKVRSQLTLQVLPVTASSGLRSQLTLRVPPSHVPHCSCWDQRRYRMTAGWQGGGKNRFNRFRDRATRLHNDFVQQLGPRLNYQDPRSSTVASNPSDGSYDPALRSGHQRAVEKFGFSDYLAGGEQGKRSTSKKGSHQCHEAEVEGVAAGASPFSAALAPPKWRGKVYGFELPGFGSIEIHHGDIFEHRRDGLEQRSSFSGEGFFEPEDQRTSSASSLSSSNSTSSSSSSSCVTWLVPMIPNFLPGRGFSLEVLERGGQGLVKDAFRESRRFLAARDSSHLDIGDVISVPVVTAEDR
ncbi:unnamed protein product, partial [Amoebophrya sp. A25]|eukprot:GSA25T00020301001.1